MRGVMAHTGGALEMWGGVECTCARVGDTYCDQLELNGHAARADDLERFAGLGLRTLRYPLLWERVAPNGVERADCSWADQRMERLRALHIRPIVGLMHHGSGPPDTNLLDPALPARLAEYAGAIAQRYPWVDAYTPVNEPLTTARFAALYGHWYPHKCDNAAFALALLQQCKATVLAMRAIRAVNPAAQLVQTDDLGQTCSTLDLAYQARFENERRWLAWDLLFGRVDCGHALWNYLRDCCGVSAADLEWFAANACPPDVIGVNHYLTSNRWLDQRLHLYPGETHGGNEREQYADVELVRACPAQRVGVAALLHQAWTRFLRPIAMTECHLGCTREEQLRWLWEVWQEAQLARRRGADVRAVTTWSLLGAFDWANLLRCSTGQYESGAFDLRSPQPRATAVARLVRTLAAAAQPDEPVLDNAGWWLRQARDSSRVRGAARDPRGPRERVLRTSSVPAAARPILITGATGTLGAAFARLCSERGLAYIAMTRRSLDLIDEPNMSAVIARLKPWLVINAAGFVRVDEAESHQERCRRVNALGPAALARVCANAGVRFVTFSSDQVFDGEKGAPYVEGEAPHPLNAYGRSKVEMEQLVIAVCPNALVIRPGPFFGPWDDFNFVTVTLRALRAGRPVLAAADIQVSPTYVPDLAHATLDLAIDHECGVWHLANGGGLSWADWARRIARAAGFSRALVTGRSAAELGLVAPRPPDSRLASGRATIMPTFDSACERFMGERGAALLATEPLAQAASA